MSPKIIIIEDDPLIVRLYEKAFQLAGYETETAFDGEDGLKKLSAMERKPDLILSDIMMPNMNGLEFLTKIKDTAEFKNIPVILLTNLGKEEDVQRGLELGAVTYLVKSQYKPKEAVEKIKEIMAGYAGTEVPEVKSGVKKVRNEK